MPLRALLMIQVVHEGSIGLPDWIGLTSVVEVRHLQRRRGVVRLGGRSF